EGDWRYGSLRDTRSGRGQAHCFAKGRDQGRRLSRGPRSTDPQGRAPVATTGHPHGVGRHCSTFQI
ncbi:hypothetical protein EV182_005751, partial [Spiromyces aspiralis]